MSNPVYWKTFFKKHTTDQDVTVLQTVGLATASSKQQMIDANIETPKAIAQGLKHAEDALVASRFVQFSTAAAHMSPESNYGGTKLQAEQELMNIGCSNLLNLRIGYAVPSLVEEKDYEGIDERHAYAPWQFSALPRPFRVHPIIGSGTQLLQPVHSDEIVNAALNFKEGSITVMGVGSTTISQENFARFYANLVGRSFHPIYLPYEVVKPLSRHFEEGYFSEHAADALKMLESTSMLYSTKDFEALLGTKPKTLNKIYATTSGKPIIYTKPPIKEHGQKVLKTLRSSSKARSDLINIFKNYGCELTLNVAKTVLGID